MHDRVSQVAGASDFLAGGRKMAGLIHDHDWSGTPIGAPGSWPLPLRTLLGVTMGSNQPMFVAWGPERTLIYNDAYAEILASKHPGALGRDFLDVWHEIRGDLLPIVERAYGGEPVQMDDITLMIERKGYPEETHFAFSYTPVRDGDGTIAGFFCACQEITGQVLAERRLRQSEARLRGVLGGMGEAFGFMDRDFRIWTFNEAALRLESRPLEEIVGRTHWEVYPGSENSEVGSLYKRALAEERPVSLEHRYTWEDGTTRWLEMRAYPVPEGLAVFWHDISDRKAAEAERLSLAQQNIEILESISDAFYAVDRDWRFIYLNRETEKWWGRSRADLLGKVYWDEFPQAVGSEPYKAHLRAMETREVVRLEAVSPILGHWVDISIFPTPDGGLSVYFRDISGKKRADVALRESEDRFRAIVETATDYAIFTTDAEGLIETWPAGAQAVFGWRAAEAIGQPVDMTFVPEDRALGAPQTERLAARTAGQCPNVRWHLRADGARVFIDGVTRPLRGEDGTVTGFVKVGQDVTERRATEDALRASEAQFRAFAQAVPNHVWAARPDGALYWFNDQVYAYCGEAPGSLDGSVWARIVHPDDRPQAAKAWTDALATGQVYETEFRIRRADGCFRWFLVRAEPVRGGGGSISNWVGTNTDIHDRRRAEEALRELNETLEARVAERTAERDRMWETSPDLMLAIDFEGVFRRANPAWTTILGYAPEDLMGHHVNEFVVPDDHAVTVEAYETAAHGGQPRVVNRYRAKDGSLRWISWTAAPAGDVTYATGRDITAERERQAELEAAQEQLRQSQKMEAMGQLTGGVAHDFNNLLTPIIGSLDRLLTRGVGSSRERQLMDGALQSAERAKTLVQRLLAFARRQPLQPTAVDVGQLVTSMADLLSSTTGPRIDVRVDLPPDLPPALADANQLEMALLNLAVNARDAMPEGGVLTISAARESVRQGRRLRLRPGHYVRLSVRDTGVGMDEATAARAVEPFFSTKGVGRGTGLGLSMVHGLASQLGGGLTIRSQPGRGTTVELWLPISTVAVEEDGPAPGAAAAPQVHGTALLVDDEDFVRMSTADMLIDLGYEVVEATSAEEALRQVRTGLWPDLVVTDHLMPGMSGVDLARELRTLRPELPVLIVSGYAETEGIAPGVPRLTKPFRAAELAASLSALVADGRT